MIKSPAEKQGKIFLIFLIFPVDIFINMLIILDVATSYDKKNEGQENNRGRKGKEHDLSGLQD